MANKVEVRAAILKAHEKPHGNTWRNRRWAFLLAVNLLFVVSFYLDIQILEGSLSASRLIGFHLIDLNSALQVMLAHKHIIVNLVIGTAPYWPSGCCWAGAPFAPGFAPTTLSPSLPKSCTCGWPRKVGV
jgi:hypothetical protein